MESYFSNLSPEVISLILCKLDAKSIVNCRCVSRKLEQIISTSGFWMQLLLQSEEFETPEHKILLQKIKDFEWKFLAQILIKNPFYKNLLVNGSAESSEEHEHSERGGHQPRAGKFPFIYMKCIFSHEN